MFNFLFNRKKFTKKLAKDVVKETQVLFDELNTDQNTQFDEIKTILQLLTEKMDRLENRLTVKEMQDKTTYGHLQYKISELQTDIVFDNKKSKNKQ